MRLAGGCTFRVGDEIIDKLPWKLRLTASKPLKIDGGRLQYGNSVTWKYRRSVATQPERVRVGTAARAAAICTILRAPSQQF